MAVAGGVNVITSPSLHQNLAAASFLNPEGSSKAFDESANGYCRGEGAGLLVLKPLSCALADDDLIIGVISGSAVNQGSNSSPITVPHADSQRALYQKALATGNIDPAEVTYVEAHGTGTQVGDPIEYESVRSTFASPRRKDRLFLGSVKDSIGHTEAASGVAGVIKSLLMMTHRIIPRQANFKTLNPCITSPNEDLIKVPITNEEWTPGKRGRLVALINNYGAAGSNAAIVLRQHVGANESRKTLFTKHTYPILLAARTHKSLLAYLASLNDLKVDDGEDPSKLVVSQLAHAINRRSNPAFEYRLALQAHDAESWNAAIHSAVAPPTKTQLAPQKPVVLCFGGQTGKHPRISRNLYESCAPFRKHLDACADICAELHIEQLLPSMLDQQQVNVSEDIVALQCYAVIGHSFGQLTASCVAGSLSLRDAVYFIAGRARLMRDAWQGERGTMLSVDCDPDWFKTRLELLNNEHGTCVSVACYNGPSSFVAAGDTASIARLEEALREQRRDEGAGRHFASKVKTTRLESSHAFHSHLTDSILPALEDLAKSIEIRSPPIYVETCSEGGPWSNYGATELVQHTRGPVFFHDAVRRLEDRLEQGAIWLEAGSNTPIIPMTRRIVNLDKEHTLLPVDDLGGDTAAQNVADITCKLWVAGKGRHDWTSYATCHDDSNAACRAMLCSPPYQFDTAEHWMQYKAPGAGVQQHVPAPELLPPSEPPLIQHYKKEDDGNLFAVNTASQIFQLAARGHAVAGQSLCPASMYCELATRCCAALHGHDPVDPPKSLLPHIQDLTMSAPLGLSPDSSVWLRISGSGGSGGELAFAIFSRSTRGIDTEHARGAVSMLPTEDKSMESRIRLLTRLARDPCRAAKLLSSHHEDVSGNMVYRVFDEVVSYADYYRGVQQVTGSYNESAGRVSLPAPGGFPLQDRGLCDAIALDNFLQVAGIHVNCLSERPDGCVFMCVKVEEVLFAPEYVRSMNQADEHSWVVHSRYDAVEDYSDKAPTTIINNIFVYDDTSKNLVVGIIGATFQSVPFKSVMRNLARLSKPGSDSPGLTRLKVQDKDIHQSDSGYQTSTLLTPSEEPASPSSPLPRSGETAGQSEQHASQQQMLHRLRDMIAHIIEMPMEEVLPTSKLETLGIDSLLVTEVTTEIEKHFGVSVGRDTVLGVESVSDLSRCIFPVGESNDRSRTNTNEEQGKLNEASQVASDTRPKAGQRRNETENSSSTGGPKAATSSIAKAFAKIEDRYDEIAQETGFSGFYTQVYPLQSELVVLYIVEAFASLGCDLRGLATGALVPTIQAMPKHKKLVPQLYRILERSETSASSRYEALLSLFPAHASETKLLATTGPYLAECLSGTKDPIDLIFGTAAARLLLEDVYANAPMFLSGTHQLCRFLCQVVTAAADFRARDQVRILEIGAGTGGTTRYLLEALTASQAGVDVVYTFTDLSSSLVAAAKRKFAKYTKQPGFHMEFSVLDLEAETLPQWALDSFDIVVSTNCVHATRDLARSTSNINSMLRTDHEAMLCLVELMPTDLYWFDLVFGLLEGWWMFDDGRNYALANEEHWKRVLRDVGFGWVRWTNSPSREASVLKIIAASKHETTTDIEAGSLSAPGNLANKETVVFKKVDGLELHADIYYPEQPVQVSKALPIALMIHGGGHVMLSRKDVRPEQIQWLLRDGFLPISIDYRLCHETNLSSGPIADVADALVWARETLPRLKTLRRSDISPDGDRVVAIGWSTGGMLALSLGWTKLCQPPDAILAMYCPSDYEDPFWRRPNRPAGSDGAATTECEDYTLDQATISACSGRPIAAYNVSSTHGQSAIGGWLAPWDPRSRLALHMNWHGRTLDVLLNGLDALSKQGANSLDHDMPPLQLEAVRDISPLARVRRNDFAPVPTFLIHSSKDDLIPVAQAERMYTALKARGIEAQLRVLEGQKHLFDVYPRWKADRAAFDAVTEGYNFLKAMVS
ncbi:hypothetical protein LA080_005918 [Diaporthe eres]|nr:hypothetical protein LA080_005918 [Diaporthe eres]